MNAAQLNTYLFSTAEHWGTALRQRFQSSADGALQSIGRIGAQAIRVSESTSVSVIAAAPDTTVYWRDTALHWLAPNGNSSTPFNARGDLAMGTRWVVDRSSIWSFAPGGMTASQWNRASLEMTQAIDVAVALSSTSDFNGATFSIRDIASDKCGGIWLLVSAQRETAGDERRDVAIHFDSVGKLRGTLNLPENVGAVEQIGVLKCGKTLALLGCDGKVLLLLESRSGKLIRRMRVNSFALCGRVSRLSTDGTNRIALYGEPSLYILDGEGELIDASRADSKGLVRDLAIHRDTVWFATETGVWRTGAGSSSHFREAESYVLLPLLLSPESDRGGGWLRAELSIDLPAGAALEAEIHGTNDERVARSIQSTFTDSSRSAQSRIEDVWSELDPAERKRYRFTGAPGSSIPIEVPLFEVRTRWLVLGLRVVTPPGVPLPSLTAMRVLYPNVSLEQNIPAVFRGSENDPNGFLRRLVGVLESTTQGLDARIGAISRALNAAHASEALLDYLADWVGVPWDNSLPVGAKRAVLRAAAEIIAHRGTRAGLQVLLKALIQSHGRVAIADLTVDYAVARVGGRQCLGAALPALLPGVRVGTATLNGKAIMGRARLPCAADIASAADPLAVIAPFVKIEITTDRKTRAGLSSITNVLRQYLPAGVRYSLRWRLQSISASDDEAALVLDGHHAGVLGSDSLIGNTTLAGSGVARIHVDGLDMGFTL